MCLKSVFFCLYPLPPELLKYTKTLYSKAFHDIPCMYCFLVAALKYSKLQSKNKVEIAKCIKQKFMRVYPLVVRRFSTGMLVSLSCWLCCFE